MNYMLGYFKVFRHHKCQEICDGLIFDLIFDGKIVDLKNYVEIFDGIIFDCNNDI